MTGTGLRPGARQALLRQLECAGRDTAPDASGSASPDYTALLLWQCRRYALGEDAAVFRKAVEGASGGHNTVLFDDAGLPSIVCRVELPGGGAAFVSKYLNVLVDGLACSLPLQDPAVHLDFDDACRACAAKGAGWHLLTGELWQLLAGQAAQGGAMPRGNTDFGRAWDAPEEAGEVCYHKDGKPARTRTGSGPDRWNHDGSPWGAADLCGNIWEWTAGLRLLDGEIQIIPDGRAMLPGCDLSRNSAEWRAVLPDGRLCPPQTAGALHMDAAGQTVLSQNPADITGRPVVSSARTCPSYAPDTDRDHALAACRAAALEVRAEPAAIGVLQRHGLLPPKNHAGDDALYVRNYGERLSMRGGRWPHGPRAGMFALDLCSHRRHSVDDVGFRAAFAGR